MFSCLLSTYQAAGTKNMEMSQQMQPSPPPKMTELVKKKKKLIILANIFELSSYST